MNFKREEEKKKMKYKDTFYHFKSFLIFNFAGSIFSSIFLSSFSVPQDNLSLFLHIRLRKVAKNLKGGKNK